MSVTEEQIRCYELRLTGMSLDAIAKATRLSKGAVHNRIQAEIRERVLPLADEVRKMELDWLDRWLAKLDAQTQDDRSVARNVEVAVKVSERRARLLGIDAPEKVEATVTEITRKTSRSPSWCGRLRLRGR
ncbi:MAG TPA: hypothetical protein VN327_15185 [Pseudonocardiaceae bacterium]|nr:hypothetical protein [Pseudonocardiaceae bacterium]